MKGKNKEAPDRKSEKKTGLPIYAPRIKRIALNGLLFALALVFSMVEAALSVPVPVPGVRLGLSNIIVMYAIFFLKKKDAAALALLKGLFVLVTRGFMAGMFSLSGGLLSVTVMALLLHLFKEKLSYLSISVFGALFHNIGQIFAVYILTGMFLWVYLPILMVSGVAAGAVTSILLKITLPALKKINS